MLDKQQREFDAMLAKQGRNPDGSLKSSGTGSTSDGGDLMTNPTWADTTVDNLDKLTNDFINRNDAALKGGTPPGAPPPAQPSIGQQIGDAEEAALEAENTRKVQEFYARAYDPGFGTGFGDGVAPVGSIDWSQFGIGNPDNAIGNFSNNLLNSKATIGGGSTVEAFNASIVGTPGVDSAGNWTGNDTIAFNNQAPSSVIFGGGGINMAEFAGDPENFEVIKYDGGAVTVTDKLTGNTTELVDMAYINIIPPGGESSGIIYSLNDVRMTSDGTNTLIGTKSPGQAAIYGLIDNKTNTNSNNTGASNTNTFNPISNKGSGGASSSSPSTVDNSSTPEPETGWLDAVINFLGDIFE